MRLDEVVLRALEQKPELRYQQASEVKTCVETIAATPASEGQKVGSGQNFTSVMVKSERARLTVQESADARTGYPAMGEVALFTDRLMISSGHNQRSIPLADIHELGEAVLPFWLNPGAHRYAAVDFDEAGQRRRLVFLAGTSLFRSPWDTRRHAAEWLTAIQRTVKSADGRDLPIADVPTVVPVRIWWSLMWLLIPVLAAAPLIVGLSSGNGFNRVLLELTLAALLFPAVTLSVVFIMRSIWLRGTSSRPPGGGTGVPPRSEANNSADDSTKPPSGKNSWFTGPLSSPDVREIAAHLTKGERREVSLIGLLWGVWVVVAIFGGMFLLKSFPAPGNWIAASVILALFIVSVPTMLRMQRRFLCSTAWAKTHGYDADRIKLFSFSRQNLRLVLAFAAVVILLGFGQYKLFNHLSGLTELTQSLKQMAGLPARPASVESDYQAFLLDEPTARQLTKTMAVNLPASKAVLRLDLSREAFLHVREQAKAQDSPMLRQAREISSWPRVVDTWQVVDPRFFATAVGYLGARRNGDGVEMRIDYNILARFNSSPDCVTNQLLYEGSAPLTNVLLFLLPVPRSKTDTNYLVMAFQAACGERMPVPTMESYSTNSRAVYYAHDGTNVNFALFCAAAHSGNVGNRSNSRSTWQVRGDVSFSDGRVFPFSQSSARAAFLDIGAQTFNLHDGSLLVLNADGTIVQRPVFPGLAAVRNLDEITRLAASTAAEWSPVLLPGEKPDLSKIRIEVQTLMEQRQYEEALQRQLWYFNHALEYGEPDAIRLSFGIMYWGELARRYPKAKQALLEIRDRDVREFAEGRGYVQLFQEVLNLNGALQDENEGVALFDQIRQQDKQLARQCFRYIEDALMQQGKYQLCLEFVGDPQSGFEALRQTFNTSIQMQQRMEHLGQMQRQFPAPAPPPVPAGLPPRPDLRQMATNSFVGEIRKLVEILVATGRRTDAEKIRDEAVEVFADPRLESAVSDAMAKLQRAGGAANLGATPDPGAAVGSISFGGQDWLPWRMLFAVKGDKVVTLPKPRPGFNYGSQGGGRGPLLFSNVGNRNWRDYRAEFEFCVTGMDPAFNPYRLPLDYHDGEIWFHVADAKESWNDRGVSAYVLAVHGDGTWFLRCTYNEYCAVPRGYGLREKDGERMLGEGAGLNIDPENGNKYAIEIKGQRIRVWIDGEKFVDVTDGKMGEEIGGQTLDHGGIGFVWGYDAMGWVRNFSLSKP